MFEKRRRKRRSPRRGLAQLLERVVAAARRRPRLRPAGFRSPDRRCAAPPVPERRSPRRRGSASSARDREPARPSGIAAVRFQARRRRAARPHRDAASAMRKPPFRARHCRSLAVRGRKDVTDASTSIGVANSVTPASALLGGVPTATMLAKHQSHRCAGVNRLTLSLGMQSGRLTVGGHHRTRAKPCAMAARPARGSEAAPVQAQRKTPGSFLPGVLLESCQTIGIRSCAERER